MASTSSGQTSTQTVQPFSAMHLDSSTRTGTWVMVAARVMRISWWLGTWGASSRFGAGGDAQALVGGSFFVVDRHDVGLDRLLAHGHQALRITAQQRMAEPVRVVALGVVDVVVVQAPAALGAEHRGARGHLGAIEDRMRLHRAHQL